MKDIDKCTEELTEAICASRSYLEFEEAKKKIEQYPELHDKLTQFRKKNYELQNGRPDHHWYEEVMAFEKSNEAFRQNPLVKEYLNSELELCRIIREINFAIMQTVQLDIEEFAEEIHL